ncbi:PAP2 domain-containing protein [Coccidioides immitis RS]|uniref:PAP2 domain-containing protein n=2 Tax=Coccidioides immitis TaxID=5501 RepID=J3K154_COCIM|nr:PAP2 domain-containing protein [Coccidioides immitis RS]EAS27657.3 PAP2 domain-containing protein [Coccidioides immitis RS]
MGPKVFHRVRSSMSSTRDLQAPWERPLSKRLIISYVVDWIFILFTGALGRIVKVAEPNRRPFSLTDQNISYPFAVHERVPVATLMMASLLVPAAVIAVFSMLIVPGPADKRAFGAEAWRRKFWEWNAGWMGLGVAYAGVYAATEAMKVMFGKPRPDLLDRCDPDLSNIAAHVIGGLGGQVAGAPSLVSWTICRNTTKRLLKDGFVSFPSGHSSMSFAGLTYLSLWLCAKLAITIPFLSVASLQEVEQPNLNKSPVSLRNRGAAPPTVLVLLVFVPIVAATYIASSRWADSRHFAFDILFGALLGIAFAWLGFRLYHLPLNSGQGWAWGARDKNRAFFGDIDHTSYAADRALSTTRNAGSFSPNSAERNRDELLPTTGERPNGSSTNGY